ncbi:hypothetical protein AS888_20710 [Peribacillus simplex]|uniref:Uncharacterized protein n=1 Tax=Peribacillus simplex TaxID=1478 RepID=A0A109MX84_9BACI|nr:hypothetical protein [Peribacillus simplex]KWW17936.1 hypothetical protein AS888_20710 [Peribacillus simplex]
MRFVGIDPSTKTGFVAMDQGGIVLKAKELKGLGSVDPKRIVTLTDEIMAHVLPGDVICIEGVPFDTQRAAQAGWIHGSIRNALFRRNLSYYEAAPNAVKKFVNVTGWVGEVGHKKRLVGKDKKLAVMKAVEEHFGFVHASDNVVDAYILAEIAKSIWWSGNISNAKPNYQHEVIDAILNPVTKPKKKKKVAKV